MRRTTFKLAFYYLLLLFYAPLSSADVSVVNSVELQAMIDSNAIVIDIRRQDEWENTGIIKDSHTATFFDQYGSFNTEEWVAKVSPLLQSDQPVVLICHSGVRSKWVANWLDKNTDTPEVYDATEGVAGWLAQGKPTEKY